jgi:hypothetical protein
MNTTYATLPNNLTIDGIVHVQHWRSRDLVIYQNYDERLGALRTDGQPGIVLSSGNPSQFHLYRVIQHHPGESLGEKIATFSDLNSAIDRATKEGITA